MFKSKMTTAELQVGILLTVHLVTVNCAAGIPATAGGGSAKHKEGAITVMIIVGVISALCFFFCWLRKKTKNCCGSSNSKTNQCPLCLLRVPPDEWGSGEHRRQCANRFSQQLDMMPKHHSKKCPLCRDCLRLWPQQGGYFKCHNRECFHGGSVDNTGDNRYTCFSCDLNFCQNCVLIVEDKK